jgi:hypothetical protein
MNGIIIQFKNKPNDDGTLSNFKIEDCLISQNGTPTTSRPQVLVHLPKIDKRSVDGAWFDYADSTYHVIGVTAPNISEISPTRWNRYCIAEKIY